MNSTPCTEYNDCFNKSTQSATSDPKSALQVFMIVADVIIIVLGLTGNGLVIWIAGFKVKKSVSTIWYLSLAMSDFLFCGTLIFKVILVVSSNWIFGSFICHFGLFLFFLERYSSIILLVIISIDRSLVVTFPVWAQNKRTISKALMVVLMVWIISAGFSLPNAIFRSLTSKGNTKIKVCSYSSETFFRALIVYSFTFLFLIPLLIITICYGIIFQKMKTNATEKSIKRLKVLIVLIANFLICWLPYHIIRLIRISEPSKVYVSNAYNLSVILGEVSCVLNPFLYAFMGKNFKTQCWKIVSNIQSTLSV